ncbi:MAG TPA: hypothetical protein VGL91_04215 [Acidobacteriota bacterium]|jgi:hypothetical protein
MSLKTALQFGGLDELRKLFAALNQRTQQKKLVENEAQYARWLTRAYSIEGASAGTLTGAVRGFAAKHSNFTTEMLQAFLPLGSGWRSQALAALSPNHQPLSAGEIAGALERFFQWTGDQAFAELHPVEQAALSQARLLEIGPFAKQNIPLACSLSCFWLFRGGFVYPIWEYDQPEKYREYLDSAFRLEMQPLIDYLLRGEKRALQAILTG